MTDIKESAFEGYRNLKEINLPEELERIEAFAFMHSGVRKITIPDSVTEIGGCAFPGCRRLKTVILP